MEKREIMWNIQPPQKEIEQIENSKAVDFSPLFVNPIIICKWSKHSSEKVERYDWIKKQDQLYVA